MSVAIIYQSLLLADQLKCQSKRLQTDHAVQDAISGGS
jgi:hypothetical protein